MSRRPRRKHSLAFKSKVALATIQCEQTVAELAHWFDIHPKQLSQWKIWILERLAAMFEGGNSPHSLADVDRLCAKMGELILENDFLETALPQSGRIERKVMIDLPHWCVNRPRP